MLNWPTIPWTISICFPNWHVFFSEKYPQIKKLFGVDPTFKWKVMGLVLIQFAMLMILKDMSWPIIIITAYLFGGVINHALMLGKHPILFSSSRPRPSP